MSAGARCAAAPALGTVVVTNFSVRRHGRLPGVDWVDARFELLRRTAFPSLVRQHVDGLVWLVRASAPLRSYVDSLMRGLSLPAGHIAVATPQDQAAAVCELLPGVDRFLTARLDSDDAFMPTALGAAAGCTPTEPGEPLLLNFPAGYQLDWRTGALYPLTFDPAVQGPFLALANVGRAAMLDYGGEHRQARAGRRVVDVGGRQWIQVVHGGNVCNRIRRFAEPLPAPEAHAVLGAAGVSP